MMLRLLDFISRYTCASDSSPLMASSECPKAMVMPRKPSGRIEPLKDAIKGIAWSGEIKAEMLEVMINARHQDALQRGRIAALRTIEALRGGVTLELAAMDLRIAVNAIGEIVGQTTTEDLLDVIFSQFCIGK